MNRYDFVAPIYDVLKRIVFGRALNNATAAHLNDIDQFKNILIVGGGTGANLPLFDAHHIVDFIDASPAMIQKAKKRKTKAQVQFHSTLFDSFVSTTNYDLILFPFFLDLFDITEGMSILQRTQLMLAPQGRLIVTDFHPVESLNSIRQKLLLRTVIVFFIITTRHRYTKIFNIKDAVKQSDYQLIDENNFVNGMVFATIWKKTEH